MENNRLSHNKNKTHTILLARVKKTKKKEIHLATLVLKKRQYNIITHSFGK